MAPLPAKSGACHGVMLGQGNASTSPTFTPSLLFQCQVRVDLRSEGGPAPWGRGTSSWLLMMYHYCHPKGRREEQHWPHSMPWLTPPSSQGTPLDSREEHRKFGSI